MFFECRWIEPGSGAQKTKTTKYPKRREAERYAMELERKLNAGETGLRRATFKAFRKEYEDTVFPGQKLKTQLTTKSTFNAIETILKPSSVQSIDMAAIRKFTKEIRKLPAKGGTDEKGNIVRTVSEFTVARHLTELRKILRWAAQNNFAKTAQLVKVPEAKGRKGRDITEEEFERMLEAVRKIDLLEPLRFRRALKHGG